MAENGYQGFKPGDVISGKYRVERVLGAGGMGIVLAAYHMQLEERVAIKLLLPEIVDVPEAVARFSREARAAVKIKSEHVARVTDVGTAENGAPYMVMEYLEGDDLSAWIKQKGPLPIKQAIEFVLQASEALAEAHSIGIIHRDLKPANLFCIQRPDGSHSIKVLDFGISKVTGPQSTNSSLGMTSTTAMMGTPYYMSPEQLRSSRDVDARTDIWALGAILYELLTGKLPFSADMLAELCIQIVNDPTPLVRTLRPEVPLDVDQAIGKCLEKNREQRFAHVGELVSALVPFGPTRARVSVDRVWGIIQGSALSATGMAPPPSSASIAPAAPPQTGVAWGQTAPGARRSHKWLAGLVVGFASVVALVAAWFVRSHARADHESPTAAASQSAAPSASAAIATATAPLPVEPSVSTQATAVAPPAAPSVSAADAGMAAAGAAPTPTEPTPTAPATAAFAVKAKPVVGNKPKQEASKPAPPVKEVVPAPAPQPEPAKAAPAAPKANCDPPYTLDDQGRKHFKAECF